ncbi:hypothetical protein BGX38DRAFT_1146598 [Terfezia claveryi]|nr:hypothetical protein BGX38DRAFT_1146598 [Terfezia claveryi]
MFLPTLIYCVDIQLVLFRVTEVFIIQDYTPSVVRSLGLFHNITLDSCSSHNRANMASQSFVASPSLEDDETLGIYIDPRLHCPPNIKELIDKHQVYNNNLILTALDSLTPMKEQLYVPQEPKYCSDTYHMWRQLLLDARETYNNAFSGVLYVREYLAMTESEYHASQRQWRAIETREKAQSIMLTWLDRDINGLGNLLTRYSYGLVGPLKIRDHAFRIRMRRMRRI